MNEDTLRQGRMFLNVLWVVLAVSLSLPGGGLVGLLQTIFWVMLAAHVIEFAIFHRKILMGAGSAGHHIVQTLLYGFIHIKKVELESAGAATN